MARPRKFDEDTVVTAVKEVFWEKGYEGTSYGDLTSATGLHKQSLYQAFGDKRDLYLRALQAYNEMEVEGGIQLLTDPANGSGTERIVKLLTAVITAVTENKDLRGCLLCNAAIDQAPHDPQTADKVQEGLGRMQNAIENTLAGTRNISATASQILAVYFGMRMMAKTGVDVSMLEQARTAMIDQLKTHQ